LKITFTSISKMRARVVFITLAAFVTVVALGRFLEVHDMKSLVRNSTLVFLGRVKSVAPSGITTKLGYPTWEKVVFEWLRADVEVIEPIKGTQKGELVQVAMLSAHEADDSDGMINPPRMLAPKRGDRFLFCLAPTSVTNLFASFTAPYDDDQAIFPLDRNYRAYSAQRAGTEKQDSPFFERHTLIWSLVGDSGQILPGGAEQMRTAYQSEITAAPSNRVIYLQWQTVTNKAGWFGSVPKMPAETNQNKK
jgi:hypothetical protein